MKSTRSSNPNDFSYNRRSHGLVRPKDTKPACMENWKWGNRPFRENQATACQEIEELRRNLLRGKEIEHDKQELMNCPCIREEILRLASQLLTQIRDFQNKVNSLSGCEIIIRSLIREQLWSRPKFPVNPLLFWVPEPCLAAILDCRTIYGILWVLQETFKNDHLLEKDNPRQSSTIQRMWHPPLRNWGLISEDNTSKDPFSRCEICKNLGYRLSWRWQDKVGLQHPEENNFVLRIFVSWWN